MAKFPPTILLKVKVAFEQASSTLLWSNFFVHVYHFDIQPEYVILYTSIYITVLPF
jgi:hypothetical protein